VNGTDQTVPVCLDNSIRQIKALWAELGSAMPLYAYHCSYCRHEFETLVRSDETPECPSCRGVKLERLLSLIAKPAAGGDSDAGACAAMGGGAPSGGCPALGG
jgi:putative FmdB family regulatory protein